MVNNIFKKVDLFFFSETERSDDSISFLRFSTGLFLIVYISSVALDFQLLFGKYGVIPYDIQDFLAPNKAITFSKIVTFSEGFQIGESSIVLIFLLLFYLSSLFLMIGFLTRFSSILLLFLYIAISSGPFKYGVDVFVTTGLFYLSVFPASHKYAVDKFIFKTTKSDNYTPYLRLLQFTLCLVYFFGGISKAIGSSWYDGHAIWKSLNLIGTITLDYTFLASNEYLLTIIGWSVLILEIFYFIAIWNKSLGRFWFIAILLMHLGISIFLGLYMFGIYMIILNISGFYFSNFLPKTSYAV